MAWLHPKKRFGQHYLTDRNIIAKILKAASIAEGDRVLEIGSGPGSLTEALIDAGASVTAIEIDRDLSASLKERFSGSPRFELIEGDALQVSFLKLKERCGTRLKVVSNLPYNITGPVLFKFIEEREAFSLLVLMLQKEVAERIVSGPGTKDYGILSVLSQVWFDVRMEFKVSRKVFYPPPRVDSSVVSFMVRSTAKVRIDDEEFFIKAVKAAFGQRRKTLLNSMTALGHEKEAVLRALEVSGIDPKRRGETLDLTEFGRLAEAFSSIKKQPGKSLIEP